MHEQLPDAVLQLPWLLHPTFELHSPQVVPLNPDEQLQLKDAVELVGTFDRPELTYRVLPRQSLIDQVVEGIGRHGETATIIYCMSRKDTETLAKQLNSRRIQAEAYHAGMSAVERTRISADFRAERLNVVCATVAFGMGIDRSDVRLVVHAAMPKSI